MQTDKSLTQNAPQPVGAVRKTSDGAVTPGSHQDMAKRHAAISASHSEIIARHQETLRQQESGKLTADQITAGLKTMHTEHLQMMADHETMMRAHEQF